MEGLTGRGISSMPGPPPRQHEYEKRYTLFTLPSILTKQIWKDDHDCQMIFGDLVGLKLPEICFIGEEKPRENLTQETSRPGIEPGPAAWQARMLPPAPQRWTNLSFTFLNRISLLFISSSYPIVLARLVGPRSRPYTSRKFSREGL